MVFSSLMFMCIFLPIVLIAYNLSKNLTYKNTVLIIASLFFYAWGEPIWVVFLNECWAFVVCFDLSYSSFFPFNTFTFFKVKKSRTLVTPAPTAASVIARSGDSMMNQMIDIIKL